MMVYQDGIEVDAGVYAGLEFMELTTVFQTLIDAVNMSYLLGDTFYLFIY